MYPYLYTTSSALPVELVRFEAEGDREGIRILWSTASETNNKEFIVERTRNARDFIEVARAKGAGNSTTLIEYAARDDRPFEGMNFYRLRQIDFDGREHTTRLVSARYRPMGMSVTVTPNPVKDNHCMVRYFAEKNSTVALKVLDLNGTEMLSRSLSHSDARHYDYSLSLDQLQKGVYLLKVVSDLETATSRLIVQ
jgi:hypothetical protein